MRVAAVAVEAVGREDRADVAREVHGSGGISREGRRNQDRESGHPVGDDWISVHAAGLQANSLNRTQRPFPLFFYASRLAIAGFSHTHNPTVPGGSRRDDASRSPTARSIKCPNGDGQRHPARCREGLWG
jgi:hypothetical protein